MSISTTRLGNTGLEISNGMGASIKLTGPKVTISLPPLNE